MNSLFVISAIVLCVLVPEVVPTRTIPKWKKQACELPATQQDSNSHYTCDESGEMLCLTGWTGDMCDVPICRKGCDPLQGYCKRPGECRCKLGFYGEKCDKCIPLPGCQHGYCNSSFECNCHKGWDGIFCSEPVCRSDCHPQRGYCESPNECRCRLGWAGETCKECQVLPGCQHGFCNKPLECRCQEGWTGLLCQTPICSGTCHRERGYCKKPGECRCRTGWWGKDCDECYPYPGCVHGSCSRPWECNCEPGWGGMLCDQELTYCQDHTDLCENDAKCVSLSEEDGNYRCICTEGFTGRNCDVPKTQPTTERVNATEATTTTTTAAPANESENEATQRSRRKSKIMNWDKN
ncbi:neurogenic locus protein delta-like [Neocloeon triangulifer]|uniref:neurogenic locus protein delta-like n=1 Tax=Neocloeon triangulifer TaxID=2078957 RepID=UPI00286F5E3B|nr:neurogenic locus protein delta-like [Neocloeon triangulifer]